VLWVTAQDVSRHSSYHPFAVFGFAWAARVLARNAGRFTIGIVGTASQTANTAIGVLVLLLSLSVALLLSNGIPRTRALFSDDRLGVADGAQPARAASLAARGSASAQAGDAEGAVGSDAVPAVEAPAAFAQVQTVEAAAETRAEQAAETPAGKGGENDAEGPANVRALNAVQESAAPVAKRTASAASAHAPAVGAAPSVRAASQPARPAQGEPQAEGPAEASASARSANGQATATQTAAAAPDARTPRERLVDWMADDRKLTQREIEVALLIATGRSKAVIAKKLFVSENTVRTHAKNAYAKLGVHSKQQLMDVLEAHMA
jgi:DNA-binding CsgD family transcriptional regulator